MRDATPIGVHRTARVSAVEDADPAPAPPAATTPPTAAPGLPAHRKPPSVPAPLPDLMPGVPVGLDRRTDDRLRRGRLRIDGRIDLHGMTQAEAHAALTGYLRRAHHDARRCILVITGKGALSRGGGILRAAVPRWINERPLRDIVLALHPAQPKDGGEGALYVLLKRRRSGS